MTSTVPTAVQHADGQQPPITMFGPDFPFAYDDFLAHPAGLGQVPATEHGTEVAVIGGGLSGIVAAYELMKMGLRPVVYEADQIGGRLRTVGFDGCDPDAHRRDGRDALPAVLRRRFHHYIDLRGPARPSRSPTRSRAAPRRRSSTSRASPTTPDGRRPAAGLPRGAARLERAAWRRAPTSPTMQQAMRERDVPRDPRDLGALVEKLDDQTFYGFLCDSRGLQSPSGTARSSARSASAPAAGTPTSRTPSWRSCASSTPRPTTTTAASSAAASSCRCGCGSARRTRSSHWPHGTSLASLHGGDPRPAVTRLHRTAGNRITVTDATGDIRTYRGGGLHRPVLDAARPRSHCDDSLFPIDHWTAIERTHYMESSKLFVLVDRPFWLDKSTTGRPAATSCR